MINNTSHLRAIYLSNGTKSPQDGLNINGGPKISSLEVRKGVI